MFNRIKKISIVSTTRAEYGILKPLIERLNKEKSLEVQLLVTGTHLSREFGNTITEIEQDGFDIYKKIDIMNDETGIMDASFVVSNAIKLFADYYREENPAIVIVLGDRTELLGICGAATICNIPIAHIHGGEITQGAVDDAIRHAITKMSYLHFPSTEEYKKRIIQMGEEPERVYNVGALSTENILNVELLKKNELLHELGIDESIPFAVVTYHPVTREEKGVEQIQAILSAMKEKNNYQYIITKSNADEGGMTLNQCWEAFARENENVILVDSLGLKKYLTVLKYCSFVLGNSSSGVIEAPVFGTPTINVGNRQKGRIMPSSVTQVENDVNDIIEAINKIQLTDKKEKSYMFGDGKTSEKIVRVIKKYLFEKQIDLEKSFFDIDYRLE